MRSRWQKRYAPSMAAATLLAACSAGTASPTTTSASTDSNPTVSAAIAVATPIVVTDASGTQVTIESTDRIIPLDGDIAEIVFALGLGEQVVATDLSATYPPAADAKPEIGYQRSLQAEPILTFDPTVLLATSSAGPAEVIEQLRPLVPLVIIDDPATLDGPATKIRAVARALGVPERGEVLATQTSATIAQALSRVPRRADPPRVAALYLRGDQVQLLFGPGSDIHVLLDALGVIDVGEELGVDDNQPITTEAMIAHPPDVVIVTTTGLESVGGLDALLSMPAFSRSPAAATRSVLALDDQYLYGFGPRTGQLLDDLVDAIYSP